jgi:hypothetical protein
MAMIFPGMDPYLENPGVWPGVHNAMTVYIRDFLQPRLQPRYIASLEERVYVEDTTRDMRPDVLTQRRRPAPRGGGVAVLEHDAPELVRMPAPEVHESYVAILDRRAGQQVVTVIELVSPSNKYAGTGREVYLTKQHEVLNSQAHLVEIDLLRTGPHVLAVLEWTARGLGHYDYLVSVNRAVDLRDEFEIYRRCLRERLPRVGIPLAEGDPDATLDLQAVLEQTYGAGLYRDLLPYDRPCVPALTPADQAWADLVLRDAGVRPSRE